MNNIQKVSLEDTLSLVQLMREAALAKGREAQANQLSPLADQMRKIVVTARESQPAPAPSNGVMGQSDFKTLLDLSKNHPGALPVQSSAGSVMERNGLIQAMAAANMSDVEIARQFGMTREEVKLTLSVNQKGMK